MKYYRKYIFYKNKSNNNTPSGKYPKKTAHFQTNMNGFDVNDSKN